MKSAFFIAFLLVFSLGTKAQQPPVLKNGDQAPAFSLPDTKAKTVSLSDFKGKYVILEFWGSWCPYCRKEIPQLKEFYSKYKKSAVLIGISSKDKQEPWQKIIRENDMKWINLFNEDPALVKSYGIHVFPSKIIVGPDGKIYDQLPGADPDIFSRLEKSVASIR